VIADRAAVVGSNDGRVYAIDLKTGKKLWSVPTGDAVASSPAVLRGRVIVGSMDGFLYCLGDRKHRPDK
jgi:outer membrane protein assembly factor BamB